MPVPAVAGYYAFTAGVSVFSGLMGKKSADANAEMARAQAQAQAVIMRENAARLRDSKGDVIEQADILTHDRGIDAKQMMGTQKASYAGQGVSLDSEVVRGMESETRKISQQDIDTIRTNQWKQIEGIEFEATMLEKEAQNTIDYGAMQADAYNSQGNAALIGGLLKGVTPAAKGYMAYKAANKEDEGEK